jgi:hypothetical protein
VEPAALAEIDPSCRSSQMTRIDSAFVFEPPCLALVWNAETHLCLDRLINGSFDARARQKGKEWSGVARGLRV